jgi:hypothetical protein
VPSESHGQVHALSHSWWDVTVGRDRQRCCSVDQAVLYGNDHFGPRRDGSA